MYYFTVIFKFFYLSRTRFHQRAYMSIKYYRQNISRFIKMDRAKKIIKAYPPYGITGRGIGIAILDTGICPVADFT